jgi:hypothetical protein
MALQLTLGYSLQSSTRLPGLTSISKYLHVCFTTSYSLSLHSILLSPRRSILPLTSATRPALGPTQPPVQWVPGGLPGSKCGRGVMLTTHPLLLPWVRKERGYTSSPPMRHNCYAKGHLYFTISHPSYCSVYDLLLRTFLHKSLPLIFILP